MNTIPHVNPNSIQTENCWAPSTSRLNALELITKRFLYQKCDIVQHKYSYSDYIVYTCQLATIQEIERYYIDFVTGDIFNEIRQSYTAAISRIFSTKLSTIAKKTPKLVTPASHFVYQHYNEAEPRKAGMQSYRKVMADKIRIAIEDDLFSGKKQKEFLAKNT